MLGLMLAFSSCQDGDGVDQNSDCPELSFTQDGKELFANFEGVNELEVYEWFVDEQSVETENIQNDDRDNKLDLSTFDPGTYNVCLKAETPDCPEGVEFCKEITIEESGEEEKCPSLSFTQDQNIVIADFEGINELEVYEWFVDGELAETEDLGNDRDNKLDLTSYNAGEYNVCLKAETPDCAQGTEFCMAVVVSESNPSDDDCPDLSFIEEGPILFANFPGIDQLQVYEWHVDGQLVESEDLQSQDRDDLLDINAFGPGTYNVCLKAETPDCAQGTEFCMDITIPEPQPVDCSAFGLRYLESNSGREFVDAMGAILLNVDRDTVVWKIDGNEVTSITPTGHFIILERHLTQPGKYEVCYTSESKDCGKLEECLEVDFKGL